MKNSTIDNALVALWFVGSPLTAIVYLVVYRLVTGVWP